MIIIKDTLKLVIRILKSFFFLHLRQLSFRRPFYISEFAPASDVLVALTTSNSLRDSVQSMGFSNYAIACSWENFPFLADWVQGFCWRKVFGLLYWRCSRSSCVLWQRGLFSFKDGSLPLITEFILIDASSQHTEFLHSIVLCIFLVAIQSFRWNAWLLPRGLIPWNPEGNFSRSRALSRMQKTYVKRALMCNIYKVKTKTIVFFVRLMSLHLLFNDRDYEGFLSFCSDY